MIGENGDHAIMIVEIKKIIEERCRLDGASYLDIKIAQCMSEFLGKETNEKAKQISTSKRTCLRRSWKYHHHR